MRFGSRMMGCFKGSTSPDEENEEKVHDKRFLQSKKILLLGTGESGKTTIIKQMKILHINGFSDKEKKERIPFIMQNIHESIHDMLFSMDKISPPVAIETSAAAESAKYLLNMGPDEPSSYSDDYFDHVKKAWTDPGVQKVFRRSNEYQLIDSAAHFLNQIDEIRKADYIPSLQDILFCRIKTVSISEIEFSVPLPKLYGGGSANFLMYDVGGQRGQRKKWIQVFDGIDAILFLLAASDFDQTLREDETKNRLAEAFEVFKDICTSRFVRTAALIVFLNKQDILKNKIEQGRKIEKYFPEYKDYHPTEKEFSGSEYDRARFFMTKRIKDIAKLEVTTVSVIPGTTTHAHEKLPPREVFIHYTVATDTDNVKKVFESVQTKLISDATKMFQVY